MLTSKWVQSIKLRDNYMGTESIGTSVCLSPEVITSQVIHLHVAIYRACTQKVEELALTTLKTLFYPISLGISFSRRAAIVDFCLMTPLKIANVAYQKVMEKQLLDSEKLKTRIQIKQELEKKQMRKAFGKNNPKAHFCRESAAYINLIIPKLLAEEMSILPSAFESYVLFKLGYFIRYINYQFDKKLDYKDTVIKHVFGQAMIRGLIKARTNFSHFVCSPMYVKGLIDFEFLFLKALTKLLNSNNQDTGKVKKVIKLLIRALGKSFSEQSFIEGFLREHSFQSKEEAFIARLEWHKQKGSLPNSLPDPMEEKLTTGNLSKKLDKKLEKFLVDKLQLFLPKSSSTFSDSKFLRLAYYLEGKDAVIKLASHLIVKFGINQIVDPHLFAIAILNSSGNFILDLELDGFGEGKESVILKAGKKMMLDKDLDKIQIYKNSKLKASPNGLEGIKQRKEARDRLQKFIAKMIHDLIKTENFRQPETIFKLLREKAHELPFIGSATTTLHFLVNGTFFSLGYLFRDSSETETSYLRWMFQKLSGKKLANFLAERIVALIYHPSWRITVMQILDDFIEFYEKPKENVLSREKASINQSLRHITDFLFNHFTDGTAVPFKENIGSWIDYYSEEKVLMQFLDMFKSEKNGFLEEALDSLTPLIKESILHTRITESFRKEGVIFEGDDKFFENFVKIILDRLVEIDSKDRNSKIELSLKDKLKIREERIDQLLNLDQEKMRKKFANYASFDRSYKIRDWTFVERSALLDFDELANEFQEIDNSFNDSVVIESKSIDKQRPMVIAAQTEKKKASKKVISEKTIVGDFTILG